MRIVRLAAALAAASVLLVGCSSGSLSPTSGPTATAAPAVGSSLPASDFAAAAKLPDTVLLDVRTPAEFTSGHLAGAVNVDVEAADFGQRIGTLDKTKSYAVYCRSANRSKVAMNAMQQVGFTKFFDLDGGINAWKSAGGEVVTG
jgi:rhodanese-related sulfurtransferase